MTTSFSVELSSASLFLFSVAFWKSAWILPAFLGVVSVFEAGSCVFGRDWVGGTSLLRKLVISHDEFSLNLLADKWRQVRGGDLGKEMKNDISDLRFLANIDRLHDSIGSMSERGKEIW